MTQLELSALPTRQEAEEALRSTEANAKAAQDAEEIACAASRGPDESLTELRIETASHEGRLAKINDGLDAQISQLSEAQGQRSDEQLLLSIKTSSDSLSRQEGIVSGLKDQKGDESLTSLNARILRLESAQTAKRQKVVKLKERIAGHKSRIEVAEGAGIDEAIAEKTRQLELAEEDKSRKEREVEILSLLLTTLRNAEQEAKEMYLAPVLKRVRPYLQHLFPNAKIHIDEDLHITSIERENGYEESFERLSVGTQEQIAILVRLAFAEMLIDRGHPATVVLDDSLVYSDDQRMASIFDILNIASENTQVIVLTCREQLIEGVGGKNLSLLPIDREELISA